MNVRELIEHLSKLDPELEVYTAIDAEGNGYNSLYYTPGIMFAPKFPNMYRLDEVFDEDDIEDSGYELEELTRIVVI